MSATKLSTSIFLVMCLLLFALTFNCYAANETAEDFFEQGKKFSKVKDSDHAINNYTEAIKRNPKFTKAYNNRGIAYIDKQQFDLAIADFTKAIELDPKNGKTYNNRAVAYWQKGEIARARQDIQKAQSLGIPVNPDMVKKVMGTAP
jgi:tetratricopeptide (TPR) repeat protein